MQPARAARLRRDKARWWIGTLNNRPDLELEQVYLRCKADFAVGQRERGANGTPHLQFALWFKAQARFAALKACFPDAHWETMKGNADQLVEYVTKEETRIDGPWSFGTRPVRHNSATDWDQVRVLARQGQYEEIPAEIVVKHYTNLRALSRDNLSPRSFKDVRGIWISGPPGVGKTRFAREELAGGAYYPKLLNKWWDGYQGEAYVVMDDPDQAHAQWLPSHLKIWADAHGFIAEAKGTAVAPVHRLFIVTSNYTLDELFTGHADPIAVAAVKRRFREYVMETPTTFHSVGSQARVDKFFVRAACAAFERFIAEGMPIEYMAVNARHNELLNQAAQAIQERVVPPPPRAPLEVVRQEERIARAAEFVRREGPFDGQFEFMEDEDWQALLTVVTSLWDGEGEVPWRHVDGPFGVNIVVNGNRDNNILDWVEDYPPSEKSADVVLMDSFGDSRPNSEVSSIFRQPRD